MHPKVSHSLYKKDLLIKHQEEQHRIRQLQDSALREAQKCAQVLVDEFGVRQVYLIGPLTYGKFQDGMPIEFAVEKLSEGMYASALAQLKRISTFGAELLVLHTADSWTQRSIKEKGKLLAEK